MALLLTTAVRAFGKAKYVITDQGGEFKGRVFRNFRPHQGLRGSTPGEAFMGAEPAGHTAISPPRGRHGDGEEDAPFTIGFLDPGNRDLPILKKTA